MTLHTKNVNVGEVSTLVGEKAVGDFYMKLRNLFFSVYLFKEKQRQKMDHFFVNQTH